MGRRGTQREAMEGGWAVEGGVLRSRAVQSNCDELRGNCVKIAIAHATPPIGVTSLLHIPQLGLKAFHLQEAALDVTMTLKHGTKGADVVIWGSETVPRREKRRRTPGIVNSRERWPPAVGGWPTAGGQ